MAKGKSHWIQGAIKHKGALTETAKKHGGVKKEGGLKPSFLAEASSGKYGKKTQQRANLAKTLKRMKK